MTISNLENRIKKVNAKISKRNFKSGEESKLHFLKDNLNRILNGLQRLEEDLENTLNSFNDK